MPTPMTEPGSHPWRTPAIDDLCEAVARLRTREEVARFLRDLCTLSELEAMSHRWHAARLLERGLPYLQVSRETGASTTTVTRVAHWLRAQGVDACQSMAGGIDRWSLEIDPAVPRY